MTNTKRLLALAIMPTVLLAGCGNDDSKPAKSSSSSSAKPSSSSSTLAKPVTNGKLSDVKVDTKDARNPKVTIDKSKIPFGTKDVEEKTMKEGTGKTLGNGDYVTMDFVLVNGTTGKQVLSTYGKNVTPFQFSKVSQMLPPAFADSVKKHKVGSDVLISAPASKAFGSVGYPDLKIGGNDNIVMYYTLKSAEPYNIDCSTPATDPSLPTVSGGDEKNEAKLTFPKGKSAPNKLTCATLKKGTGKTVTKGATISAVYTGQIWNGKVFDSTKKNNGKPADFAIGVGQVVPGWDRALVGRKVGDKLLLVLPPHDGYGSQGNPQAGIKGTDALVFVVEIKGAK